MTQIIEATITPKVANHALHYFNSDEGFSGGSYFDCLFRLAALADDDHIQKLTREYPAEMGAFILAQKHSGGIVMLRTIASLPLGA